MDPLIYIPRLEQAAKDEIFTAPKPEDLAGNEEEAPFGGGGGEISFAAGDFVWAKTKCYSWWPGRVYDPSKVSDYIKSFRPKRPCALVAYIGNNGYCSWCEPSQMKPFVPEFRQIVRQYRTRTFMSAVNEAVEEIRMSLRKELTCPCLVDSPSETEKPNSSNQGCKLTICNYSPVEFLDCLRGVARDASAGDLLKATMLQSWGFALQRVCLSSNSFQHCQRLKTEEIVVDELDLDHPLVDSIGEGKASISKIVEISEDMVCRSSEISMEKANVDCYETCRSDFSSIGSTPAITILSEFLSAAANPLHMRWNRSAKIVRKFFDLYRRSVYSRGSYFHAYQKHLNVCSGIFRRSLKNDTGEVPDEGMGYDERENVAMEEDALDFDNSLEQGTNGVTSLGLAQDSNERSVRRKSGWIRWIRRNRDCEDPSSGSIYDAADHSEQWKNRSERKVKKDTVSSEARVYLTSVEGKALKKKRKAKVNANGALVSCSEKNELGRKKRKKDWPCPGTLVEVGCEVSNSMDVSKTIEMMETMDATASKDPAALLLTFGRGVLLPSMDELICTFIKFGDLIELETLSLSDVGCARVLFASSRDAEKAFNNQDKISPFGPSVMSYHLCH